MHTRENDWRKTVLARNKSSGTGAYVFTRYSRPKKMGREPIFVRAVPFRDGTMGAYGPVVERHG